MAPGALFREARRAPPSRRWRLGHSGDDPSGVDAVRPGRGPLLGCRLRRRYTRPRRDPREPGRRCRPGQGTALPDRLDNPCATHRCRILPTDNVVSSAIGAGSSVDAPHSSSPYSKSVERDQARRSRAQAKVAAGRPHLGRRNGDQLERRTAGASPACPAAGLCRPGTCRNGSLHAPRRRISWRRTAGRHRLFVARPQARPYRLGWPDLAE